MENIKYIAPEMEIIFINADDIIRTSGVSGNKPVNDTKIDIRDIFEWDEF